MKHLIVICIVFAIVFVLSPAPGFSQEVEPGIIFPLPTLIGEAEVTEYGYFYSEIYPIVIPAIPTEINLSEPWLPPSLFGTVYHVFPKINVKIPDPAIIDVNCDGKTNLIEAIAIIRWVTRIDDTKPTNCFPE
jgi:hypothetical protein